MSFRQLRGDIVPKRERKHPLTLELFNYVETLVPMLAVELVILRNNRTEILLTQRPANDMYWPNQWHTPGVYIHKQELTKDALNRAAEEELGCSVVGHSFLGRLEFPQGPDNPRNHTNSDVHLCTLSSEPEEGQYFPLTDIPKNLIRMHWEIIRLVRESPQTKPVPLI